MKIHSTGCFWVLVGCLLLFTSFRLVLWLGVACFVHETGHFLAIRLLKGKIRSLCLTGAGMVIDPCRSGLFSYRGDFVIALAGPLFSFILAGLAAVWTLRFADKPASLLVGLSFSLGCFNLLPIEPLDGGKALKALLSGTLGPYRGDRVCSVMSSVSILFFGMLGFAAAFLCGNFSILLCTVWFFLYTIHQRKQ